MRNTKIGLLTKLLAFTGLIVGITCTITAYLPYQQQKKALETNLSEQLIRIANTAAIFLADQTFTLPLSQQNHANRTKQVDLLTKITHANELKLGPTRGAMYIFERSASNESKLEYITIAKHRIKEGSNYPLSPSATEGALPSIEPFHLIALNGETATTGIYHNDRGVWVSAAAPITLPDGKVIGLVQADRHIDNYPQLLAKLRDNFIIGGLLGLLIGVLLAYIFSRRVIEPIHTLLAAMQQFKDGQYKHIIRQQRSDEFGKLFNLFNAMTYNFREALTNANNAKKALQKQKSELQSMVLFVTLNPGPVMRIDSTGIISFANQSATNLLNIKDDLPPANVMNTFIALTVNDIERIIEANDRDNLIQKIGHDWYQFVLQGVRESQFINVYGVIITETIEAQERANEEALKAEDAIRSKTRFLETMSHELITPMNSISGFTQLAIKKNKDDELGAQLARISHSSTMLLELINNLLDYSKIEADTLQLYMSDFVLATIIDPLLEKYRATCMEKGLNFFIYTHPNLPTKIFADQERIMQVLINMLNNSFKFTRDGSVGLFIYEKNQHFVFEIQDTGMGIEKNQLNALFLPFKQVDGSSSRKHDGAGLGLTLSQKLVNRMNSEIEVESIINIGSTFRFTLPIGQHALRGDSAPIMQTSPQGYTLLDADVITTRYFDMLFKYEGLAPAHHLVIGFDKSLILDTAKNISNSHAVLLSVGKTICESSPEFSCCAVPASTKHIIEMLDPAHFQKNTHGAEDTSEDIELWGEDIWDESSEDALWTALPETDAELLTNHDEKPDDETPAEPNKEIENAQTHILIAEDNPMNQQIICMMLDDMEVKYTLAHNGQEALEHAQATQFNLILMDLEMPVLNGKDATIKINQSVEPCPPIIAISAHDLSKSFDEFKDIGMSGFITKPFIVSDFISNIENFLDKQKLQTCTNNQTIDDFEKDYSPENSRTEPNAATAAAEGSADEGAADEGAAAEDAANYTYKYNFDLIRPLFKNDEALGQSLLTFSSTFHNKPLPTFQSARSLLVNNDLILAFPALCSLVDFIFVNRDSDYKEIYQQYSGLLIKHTNAFSAACLAFYENDIKPLLACSNESKSSIESEEKKTLIEGFDTERAITRMGNSIERYNKMLQAFTQHNHDGINIIANNIENNNWEVAGRAAHSLKGVAATLGANALADSASNIEHALIENNPPTQEMVEVCRVDFDAAFTKVQAYLSTL